MDFSCLHCVGVCRRRGQSDDRHADVFNCSRSESERGGETAATDRQRERDGGTGGGKRKRCWCSLTPFPLPLATRPPSALWQMHGNEPRFRWNPSLPSPHTFTICPFLFLSRFLSSSVSLSHACTHLSFHPYHHKESVRGNIKRECKVMWEWLSFCELSN